MVALTFDDGPDVDGTPDVLQALRSAYVKATFFVVADRINEPGGPALLHRIMEDGHAIQAHCGSHDDYSCFNAIEPIQADVRRILDALATHGVPPPCLWRPPYGRPHPDFSCTVAAESDLQLATWTHDTQDYNGLSADQMLQAAMDAPLYDDSVILMHDSCAYGQLRRDVSQTVALIAPIVDHIRCRGFAVGPLTHELPTRPPRIGEFSGPLVLCAPERGSAK